MTAIPDPLLKLRDWSLSRRTSAGDVPILQHISLDIRPRQWLAVLGANGSGKSSLLKYLASDESPMATSAAIMFQDPDDQIFAASVERELALGRTGLDGAAVIREFDLAGLDEMDPRLLSAGQKQRLVLAVSLAAAPTVLLCDEPTALQDPDQSLWVLDRLGQWLAASGGALVTATCDRREASLADWLVVLRDGRILNQGPTADLLDTPEVVELLGTGRMPEAPSPSFGGTVARPLLEIRDLGFDFPGPGQGFRKVNLALGPGQKLGITGPNGCGKSTLMAACAGVRRPDRGSVHLGGRPLFQGRGRDLGHGVAMLAPQFPEYLFTRSTVAGEIGLDPVLAEQEPGEFLEQLGLSATLADRNPHDLSSGQRRRLALGLVLLSRRRVLLLDEPTAALDRAGRHLVLDLLAAVDSDSAVLVVSHDLPFLHEAGFPVAVLGPEGLEGSGSQGAI
jgi:energy-coupling factor transporter ATP-binding protein EcfA2